MHCKKQNALRPEDTAKVGAFASFARWYFPLETNEGRQAIRWVIIGLALPINQCDVWDRAPHTLRHISIALAMQFCCLDLTSSCVNHLILPFPVPFVQAWIIYDTRHLSSSSWILTRHWRISRNSVPRQTPPPSETPSRSSPRQE